MHCYLLAVGRRGGKSVPENPRPRRRRSALASGEKPRLALTQRRFPLSLLRTPEPSFFSSLSSIGIVSLCAHSFKPYLVSSGSPLLQATAPAREPLGPDRHPWAHVRSQPSPALSRRRPRAPVPSAISLGFRTELLGQEDLVPRFLGPPASVPGCRGRAAWDAEAPEPFGGHRGTAVRMGLTRRTRGAPGRPRWSQARRWRIFGAHCAA
ncbi:uncharacterized protein LOC116880723 [Lontra canadensis]|uniref:uncharacterized protein LOC116880723 n=1 Tax=Lontra canadensis TaxID=76717 RepID=UPI0013F32368|nr:uncharacterized protein LOC116880723 [Lontra canadensis]